MNSVSTMAGGNSRVVRDKNGKFCKGRRGVASPQTLCTCKFIVTLIIVGAYQGVATRAKRQSSSSSYSLSSSSSPSSSSPSLSVQTREWQHGLKRQSSPFAERVKVTFNHISRSSSLCHQRVLSIYNSLQLFLKHEAHLKVPLFSQLRRHPIGPICDQ